MMEYEEYLKKHIMEHLSSIMIENCDHECVDEIESHIYELIIYLKDQVKKDTAKDILLKLECARPFLPDWYVNKFEKLKKEYGLCKTYQELDKIKIR